MKKQFISLFVIAAFLMGTMISCKNASERMAEKIVEKSIEHASGEDVDIDLDNEKVTVKTEEGTIEFNAENTSWPSEVPSEVPEFKFGKITAVVTNDMDEAKGWTLALAEVSGDAVDKYKGALKAKGFETQSVSMAGMGGTLSGTKDNITVALMSGEGDATLTIQVANN